MKHTIIGGGAIGLLFAGKLTQTGETVQLVTRTARQMQALEEQGLSLRDLAENGLKGALAIHHLASLAAAQDAADKVKRFEPEVVWLAVKQPQLDEALLRLLHDEVPPAALLISLQNGIGHMERLRLFLPAYRIAAAVTTIGALRSNETTVHETGKGELWLETLQEYRAAAVQKKLVVSLEAAGIRALLSNQINNWIYRKLLLNAVINPLTALYEVKNGALPVQSAARLALMRRLHEESLAIAEAAGYEPDGKEWERLLDVCAATADNYSSMLQDVQAGRLSEIEWVNGALVTLAEKHNLAAPLNASLTALMMSCRYN